MIIKQKQCKGILNAISELKKDRAISIQTKYKILKIEKILNEESEIAYELFQELGEKYGEQINNSEIKIKDEYLKVAKEQIDQFNNQDITLPDLFFEIDEFPNLSWESLEALMPFIKN